MPAFHPHVFNRSSWSKEDCITSPVVKGSIKNWKQERNQEKHTVVILIVLLCTFSCLDIPPWFPILLGPLAQCGILGILLLGPCTLPRETQSLQKFVGNSYTVFILNWNAKWSLGSKKMANSELGSQRRFKALAADFADSMVSSCFWRRRKLHSFKHMLRKLIDTMVPWTYSKDAGT